MTCARMRCANKATVTFGMLRYCVACVPVVLLTRERIIGELAERAR